MVHQTIFDHFQHALTFRDTLPQSLDLIQPLEFYTQYTCIVTFMRLSDKQNLSWYLNLHERNYACNIDIAKQFSVEEILGWSFGIPYHDCLYFSWIKIKSLIHLLDVSLFYDAHGNQQYGTLFLRFLPNIHPSLIPSLQTVCKLLCNHLIACKFNTPQDISYILQMSRETLQHLPISNDVCANIVCVYLF